MPSRRTTLIGLGALAAGGTGAVATGAFSAATAERDVTVGFADDSAAILAFQSASAYTEVGDGDGDGDLNDGELGINFENLTQRANFRFEDTFIIINNGTDTVSLESVGSGDGGEWRNEEDSSPVGVLVGKSVNQWQGTPNTDFTANADPDIIDDGSDDDNTNGDYYASNVNEFDTIDLAPPENPTDPDDFGDWVSVGFEFGGFDDGDEIGDWEDAVPDTLQFEFGQVTE